MLRTNFRKTLPSNLIGAPSATIFRKSVNMRFDARLRWLVDLEFYCRILSKGWSFVYCDRPLVCTTSGAEHQVTNDCLDNKEVELFEWFYLYNRLYQHRFPDFRGLIFLSKLLRKHRVKSVREIGEIELQMKFRWLIMLNIQLAEFFYRRRG